MKEISTRKIKENKTMKYLVYFRPSSNFTVSVLSYKNKIKDAITEISDNELHCTLMRLYMDEKNERKAVSALEEIAVAPFDVTTTSPAVFYDEALVIRLKRKEGLQGLHQQVIDALKEFIVWEETPGIIESHKKNGKRRQAYKQYGSSFYGRFYCPHITVAHVDRKRFAKSALESNELSNQTWPVQTFFFAKKQDEWRIIKTFHLSSE